jgi:hypothetical protein
MENQPSNFMVLREDTQEIINPLIQKFNDNFAALVEQAITEKELSNNKSESILGRFHWNAVFKFYILKIQAKNRE